MPQPRRDVKPRIVHNDRSIDLVQILNSTPDFLMDGACVGRWEEFDIPHGLRGAEREQRIFNATRICATCEVLVQCRERAEKMQEEAQAPGKSYDETVGVWNDIVVAGIYYPPTHGRKN